MLSRIAARAQPPDTNAHVLTQLLPFSAQAWRPWCTAPIHSRQWQFWAVGGSAGYAVMRWLRPWLLASPPASLKGWLTYLPCGGARSAAPWQIRNHKHTPRPVPPAAMPAAAAPVASPHSTYPLRHRQCTGETCSAAMHSLKRLLLSRQR